MPQSQPVNGAVEPPHEALTYLHAEVATAARALARLGLVTAFGHLSARNADRVVITPAVDLGRIDVDDLVEVPIKTAELPPGAPPETWLHLAVYRRRPDVAAIARGQPPSAFAAGAVATELAPLHGQAAWLGRRVPVHPEARLLRSIDLADAAAASLGEQDAMVLRGNGGVAVGSSPGAAVTRLHLLEAACRVWMQAHAAGDPRPLDDHDIRAWRAAAPPLLDRLWQHLAGSDPEHDHQR